MTFSNNMLVYLLYPLPNRLVHCLSLPLKGLLPIFCLGLVRIIVRWRLHVSPKGRMIVMHGHEQQHFTELG